MLSVECSLVESEAPQRQSTAAARPATSMPGRHAANEKELSDRQSAMEATYAAFVWLFGPGCY